MNAFGRALEDELKAKNITQTEFAKRLGVTSSAVSGWATGAKYPSRGNAERIEEALDIQPRGRLRRLLVAPDSPTELPLEHYISNDETIPEDDRYALLRIVRNIRVAEGTEGAAVEHVDVRAALQADRQNRLSERSGAEEDPQAPQQQRPSRPA